MSPLRTLFDECRLWKRLSLTNAEWALVYGLTAGVIPALSGMLAMVGLQFVIFIVERRFDFGGLPLMVVFSAAFSLLYGFVPASLAFLLLRVLAATLHYINLPMTLIVAAAGAAITAFLIFGFAHPLAIALIVSTLIVTTTIWALLRSGGLGTHLTAPAF